MGKADGGRYCLTGCGELEREQSCCEEGILKNLRKTYKSFSLKKPAIGHDSYRDPSQ